MAFYLCFLRMMVNSFGPLSDRIHIFNPYFFTKPPREPRSYEDKPWFEERLSEILEVREVCEEFFNFDFHICVIKDSDHWFVIVAKLSKDRIDGMPENISLHSLDSIGDDYRIRRVNFRMDQIQLFYTSLVGSCKSKTTIFRPPRGSRNVVSRKQPNSYDAGPFSVCNVYSFLCIFNGQSSLTFPSNNKLVGKFVRDLIFTKNYYELSVCKRFDGILNLFSLRQQQFEATKIDRIKDFEEFLRLRYKYTDLELANKS